MTVQEEFKKIDEHIKKMCPICRQIKFNTKTLVILGRELFNNAVMGGFGCDDETFTVKYCPVCGLDLFPQYDTDNEVDDGK